MPRVLVIAVLAMLVAVHLFMLWPTYRMTSETLDRFRALSTSLERTAELVRETQEQVGATAETREVLGSSDANSA